MAKIAKAKKVTAAAKATPKKRVVAAEPAFDPIEWLIRTHPATASWLGHDLTKERTKR